MRRVFRPLAVFSIASGVTLAVALQFMMSGAQGGDRPTDYRRSAFSPGYDLSRLDLVDPALYHVDESYVDPHRVDWDAMFMAALQAIERRIPVCLFDREDEGDLLSVEIGEFRTVLEIPHIERRQELQAELSVIAGLLADHLSPADLPEQDTPGDPMAQVEYTLINGMLSTLDPHSVLLPPDDAHEMDVENQGEFGGLGISIQLEADGGRLVIEYPIRDTPAYGAGLRADDHIVRIDGESTINMSLDDAVERLRGPVGAPVVIEVLRSEHPEPVPYTIVRELIDSKPVVGELVDGTDIGYVEIKGFHEKVEQTLHQQLARLHREAGGELAGLILDLRGNPGGFLNQAVKVSDTFLDSGDIVSTVDGEGRQTDIDRARRSAEPDYPIAVLVDASSASASEIVAGALRFNGRAVIIGERTFGKGSVQTLHPFTDNSKLKLTISKYLTPGERSIQAQGIPADIELLSSIIPAPTAEDGPIGPVPIRLFHRERVRRERDFDRSLEQAELLLDTPAYYVRMLESERSQRRSDDLDLLLDPQVTLARDVLKAASGSSRAAVLQAAHTVVSQAQERGRREVKAAFAVHGIDWTMGAAAPRGGDLPVAFRLDVGDDERLLAGHGEQIALEVTNTTDRVLYQVAAVVRESEVLPGREFFFGRLKPGETRRYEQFVRLAPGWSAEWAPVEVDLRDAGRGSLGTWQTHVAVAAEPRPVLAWSWEVTDEQGNGDGIADVGERLSIHIDAQNIGEGRTSDPFARLRNQSGKALDLLVGNLELGELRTDEGAPCEPDGAERCRRVIAPGESWRGTFQVDLRSAKGESPLEVELVLGDNEAYDHGSVVRAGFYSWFSQHEVISILPGRTLPRAEQRRPPQVEVTRAPDPVASGPRATLSGVVKDEGGVHQVLVFAGDDKVFFEGGGPTGSIRSVPFTADIELQAGTNVLTVLAKDNDGYVSSHSVVTWFDPPDLAAQVQTP